MTIKVYGAMTPGKTGIGAAIAMLLLALGPGATSAQTAASDDFSEANTMLFLSEHLEGIQDPSVLHYSFEKRGELEEPFKDTVDVKVKPDANGKRSVEVNYFTGARNQYIPPLPDATGNPVISVFLQRDVGDMQSRTGGSTRYFQNAIKQALEDAAEVKPVKVNFEGRTVDGTRIEVIPYRDDPHRDDMGQHADKHYVFTLSDAIPGEVYELSTMVPGESGALLEETLTLQGKEPLDTNGEAN